MHDVRRTLMVGSQKQYPKHARGYLEIACSGLCHELDADLDLQSYHEFLKHDEFDLALDELEKLGRAQCAGKQFWLTLAVAAIHLGHRKRADRYSRENPSPAG